MVGEPAEFEQVGVKSITTVVISEAKNPLQDGKLGYMSGESRNQLELMPKENKILHVGPLMQRAFVF